MSTALIRVVRFTAHHHYHRPEWTEERNRAVFGATALAPGHPHDYLCAVTVSGPVSEETGMIMDLGALDGLLEEEVVRPFHGKHLNRDVPAFAYGRRIPTCEALAQYVFERLAGRLPPPVRLERVRIQEDETLYAECTGLP
jgi:6-pyruvoyltetrahydropterin/6-carboxytetrahydropterin synthase